MGHNYTLLLHQRSMEENIRCFNISIAAWIFKSSFMSSMIHLKTNSACQRKGDREAKGRHWLCPGARARMVQLGWWQLLITAHYHSSAELSRSWPLSPLLRPWVMGSHTQLSADPHPHSGHQLVTPPIIRDCLLVITLLNLSSSVDTDEDVDCGVGKQVHAGATGSYIGGMVTKLSHESVMVISYPAAQHTPVHKLDIRLVMWCHWGWHW